MKQTACFTPMCTHKRQHCTVTATLNWLQAVALAACRKPPHSCSLQETSAPLHLAGNQHDRGLQEITSHAACRTPHDCGLQETTRHAAEKGTTSHAACRNHLAEPDMINTTKRPELHLCDAALQQVHAKHPHMLQVLRATQG
jgi:hypothetical protein